MTLRHRKLPMPVDDKKEYKDLLVILSHMGSASAVLNKLAALTVKMQDPVLKQASEKLVMYFTSKPEMAHRLKFRLLDYAASYANNHGLVKNASDSIFALQQYCQKQINSQVPQWQLIASAAGWTPPSSSTEATDAQPHTRQQAASERYIYPAPVPVKATKR